MHSSLSKLAELPKETKVFCTHEYTESNLNFAAEVEPNNQILKEKINSVKILRKQDKETLPSTIESELDVNPFWNVVNLKLSVLLKNIRILS